MTQVKDLTPDELREFVEHIVEQKLWELLGDPDEGLELRSEIRERLKTSLARERQGSRGISASTVAKKLGLEEMKNCDLYGSLAG